MFGGVEMDAIGVAGDNHRTGVEEVAAFEAGNARILLSTELGLPPPPFKPGTKAGEFGNG